MSKGTKPGTALERLVQVIERATQGGDVTVEAPMFLPDKDTGKPREHDVVLTFKVGHHPARFALECRDRRRPVGVPAVEAFVLKCRQTGIDRGIIVSSTGFYATALTKAEAHGIGCLSLEEARGFNWCLAPGVVVREPWLLEVNAVAIPNRPFSGPSTFYREDGTGIEERALKALALRCLLRQPFEEPTEGPVGCRFLIQKPEMHLRDEGGERVDVGHLVLEVTFELSETFVPFEFREYVDRGKGVPLYGIAVAHLDVGPLKGSLVVVNSDEGTTVKFVRG